MMLPSFKSLIDFVLLSYVHVMYDIELPFITGLKDFYEIPILSKILRKCGGYFIDEEHLNNELYQIVVEELLGAMMKHRLILGYHLERNREKSGKVTMPKEFIFSNYINAYLRDV